MAGNFRKMTAGVGVITVGGLDVGFLKGVKLKKTHQKLQWKTGVPRTLRGTLITEHMHVIEAQSMELDARNLSLATGDDVQVVDGTPVTINDAANQEKTFAPWPTGGSIQAIILDGPNIENLVIKNQAEAVTYVLGTDYIQDDNLGVVYAIEGGAITAGQTVRVAYEYTPPASLQLNFGARTELEVLENVVFSHTRPSGKIFQAKMWKASASGDLDLDFSNDASDFTMFNVVIEALHDEAHPDNPVGYWNDEQ